MTMQVRADQNHENVFHVDGYSSRYTVTLEAADWTTGDHHCTCPAASAVPGRYCKHIVKTLQRIAAKLPQAIDTNGYRYILSGYDYAGDPDSSLWSETSPFPASVIFYQMLRHAERFTEIEPPLDEAQVITRALAGQRSERLILVHDRDAHLFYVRSLSRETLAVIDTDEPQAAADILRDADWYYDSTPNKSGRYYEYTMTRQPHTRTFWANLNRARRAAADKERIASHRLTSFERQFGVISPAHRQAVALQAAQEQ